jgi:hypothetical protein
MKEFMQVVGSEIIDNDWMEITLVPLTMVKPKKVSLMDLAGGDLDTIMASVGQKKQNKSKLYMRIEEWGKHRLCIGRHVSVELLTDETSGGQKVEYI